MKKHKKGLPIHNNVLITDAGAEGVSVAHINGKVVFVPYTVPGDVVDVQVTGKRKSYCFGKALVFHTLSDKRTTPLCSHFGVCGGCRWQHMKYEEQLFYKQKQVDDAFLRIAKVEYPALNPIIAADPIYHYRNKLEYTFASRSWIDDNHHSPDGFALGFHVPGLFDKVLDITHCYLQEEPTNKIRMAIRKYSSEKQLEYYDIRNHTGLLRNLMIRSASTNEWMVVVIFALPLMEEIEAMMAFLQKTFPEINSLNFAINEKMNDSLDGIEIINYSGKEYITEVLDNISYRISPASFFQTNSCQALQLYLKTIEFAQLTGNENVYDLYCGTGSISLFAARNAAKVVGIEYVEASVANARTNAELNNINNTVFYAGDMVNVLNDELIATEGKPDVIITDPPRAGMHPKVVEKIIELLPKRIVYVSCNPATQARDIALMDEFYKVDALQPVDMFPHTYHVENVAVMSRKGN